MTSSERDQPDQDDRHLRILHFVTGGFSGATQVAIDLCAAAQREAGFESLLVLRRKRSTDAARVQSLRDSGIRVEVVSNWSHAHTVRGLRKIIRRWRPDVVFAHGFSDHIWGRQAAIAEHVPWVFHVEHNSRERYTRRRLRQALALMPSTQASIGVSEGVRSALIGRGFPSEKCIAIPNGIAVDRFPETLLPPTWESREPAIIMAARFARQKDHATLLHALAVLRSRSVRPTLYLAGGGKAWRRKRVERLTRKLGLQEQVRFLGNVSDLPHRLAACQVFVLSSHWEGLPLALVEAMAAGCACVGSDVIGVRETVHPNQTGLLATHGDEDDLADKIQLLLEHPVIAQEMGLHARHDALTHYNRANMWSGYRKLLLDLLA